LKYFGEKGILVKMRFSNLIKAALIAGIVAVAHTPSYADQLYGVDTQGGVYAISATESLISYTLLKRDEARFGSINALALDEVNSKLYFRSGRPSGEGTGALYSFDLLTNQFSAGEVLAASVFGGSNYNAAWYNGYYWAIQEGTDILRKIDVNLGVVGTFDLDGTRNLAFGDIAITADDVLYGSSQNGTNDGFFKVDISGAAPAAPVLINDKYGILQISFNNDDSFLYGQFKNNNTLGSWYKLTKDGNLSNIGTTQVGFNDLAGPRRVPEPGTLGLLAIGALAGGLALRRRK
jgi:hypothetical protein